ncbi:MAG: hypothetical protein GC185_12250 [Alphaproteobacteria bacterium]|nr:hypothetical protein [Alphaproteobacteria bacterium]
MSRDYFKSLKSVFSRAARDPWEADRNTFFRAVKKDDLATVMDIAGKYPRECVKWESRKGSPLTVAQDSGSLNVFRFLLDSGADANENTGNDWTPLLRAVKKGRHDFALALMEKGADLNAKVMTKCKEECFDYYYYYDTPLTLAVKKSDKVMVRMLLERGASPTLSPGRNDLSPVRLAQKRKQFALADFIKRADVLRRQYQQEQKAQEEALKNIAQGGGDKHNDDVTIEVRFAPRPRRGR